MPLNPHVGTYCRGSKNSTKNLGTIHGRYILPWIQQKYYTVMHIMNAKGKAQSYECSKSQGQSPRPRARQVGRYVLPREVCSSRRADGGLEYQLKAQDIEVGCIAMKTKY
jgi:hypothetical protein